MRKLTRISKIKIYNNQVSHPFTNYFFKFILPCQQECKKCAQNDKLFLQSAH